MLSPVYTELLIAIDVALHSSVLSCRQSALYRKLETDGSSKHFSPFCARFHSKLEPRIRILFNEISAISTKHCLVPQHRTSNEFERQFDRSSSCLAQNALAQRWTASTANFGLMPYLFAERRVRGSRKLCRAIWALPRFRRSSNRPDSVDSTALRNLKEIMLSRFHWKGALKGDVGPTFVEPHPQWGRKVHRQIWRVSRNDTLNVNKSIVYLVYGERWESYQVCKKASCFQCVGRGD